MSRARPRAAESLSAPGRERLRHGGSSTCASFVRVAERADDPEGTVGRAPQVMVETPPPSRIFPARSLRRGPHSIDAQEKFGKDIAGDHLPSGRVLP